MSELLQPLSPRASRVAEALQVLHKHWRWFVVLGSLNASAVRPESWRSGNGWAQAVVLRGFLRGKLHQGSILLMASTCPLCAGA